MEPDDLFRWASCRCWNHRTKNHRRYLWRDGSPWWWCIQRKGPLKDGSSAAYAARWAAKHVVAAKLAKRCEIQLAYAIGVAEPVGVRVSTDGSTAPGITEEEIGRRVRDNFDFRPRAIIENLDLLRPIYSATSAGGHFGREAENGQFPWEQLDEA